MKSNALSRDNTTRTETGRQLWFAHCHQHCAEKFLFECIFRWVVFHLSESIDISPNHTFWHFYCRPRQFIVGFISDLLCFFIKPGGPFSSFSGLPAVWLGLIPGLLWMLLRRKRKSSIWNGLTLVFIVLSVGVCY